jgi:hypothetical protein
MACARLCEIGSLYMMVDVTLARLQSGGFSSLLTLPFCVRNNPGDEFGDA